LRRLRQTFAFLVYHRDETPNCPTCILRFQPIIF
jgi:hypothetical protein